MQSRKSGTHFSWEDLTWLRGPSHVYLVSTLTLNLKRDNGAVCYSFREHILIEKNMKLKKSLIWDPLWNYSSKSIRALSSVVGWSTLERTLGRKQVPTPHMPLALLELTGKLSSRTVIFPSAPLVSNASRIDRTELDFPRAPIRRRRHDSLDVVLPPRVAGRRPSAATTCSAASGRHHHPLDHSEGFAAKEC